MVDRQKNYSSVKSLIENGHFKVLKDLFVILRPTPTAKALGINYTRFKRRIDFVEHWTFKDAYAFAKLIGVDDKAIVDLIHNQYTQSAKKKKK
jgi:hypothetical protein